MELKLAGAKEKGDRLISRKVSITATTIQTLVSNFDSLQSTIKANKSLSIDASEGQHVRDFLAPVNETA